MYVSIDIQSVFNIPNLKLSDLNQQSWSEKGVTKSVRPLLWPMDDKSINISESALSNDHRYQSERKEFIIIPEVVAKFVHIHYNKALQVYKKNVMCQ